MTSKYKAILVLLIVIVSGAARSCVFLNVSGETTEPTTIPPTKSIIKTSELCFMIEIESSDK